MQLFSFQHFYKLAHLDMDTLEQTLSWTHWSELSHGHIGVSSLMDKLERTLSWAHWSKLSLNLDIIKYIV